MAPIGAPIDQQAVWRLVREQHHAISRSQLLVFGFSSKAIRHRLRRGRLFVEWPGVYRVGRAPLTREGRFMAAILACGDGAILSHESAANLWGIRKGGVDPVEISVPGNRRIRLKGIRVHRRNPMPPATTKCSIPLSQPLFTLVDLAATLDRDPLEAAMNEADRRGLVDPAELAETLDRMPLFPGVGNMRELLARYTRTDSNLERRFLALAKQAGLPQPQTQVELHGHRVDFLWPELNLVAETDGLTYHRTPAQQAADRKRDQALTAAGLRCVRFPNQQVRDEADEVMELLKRLREQP